MISLNSFLQAVDADSECQTIGDPMEVSSVFTTFESELPTPLNVIASTSRTFVDAQAGSSSIDAQADLSSIDAQAGLSPHSKSANISPNQESVNVTDKKFIDDDDEWVRYGGQLSVITDQANDLVNTLLNKHKIPNIIEFLGTVTASCHEIESLCKDLGSKSQILMNQMLKDIESREDYIPDILKSNSKVSHDPGCRPKIINNEERMYFIKMGPFQPKLYSFPKNAKMKASRDTCSFSPKWYNDYPYIEYSIEKDMAYCFVCKLFSPHGINAEKSEEVWTEGFNNWCKAMGSQGKGKQGKIPTHFQSNSHKAALMDYATFCNQSEHVDLLLDKEKRAKIIEEEKIIKKHRDVIVMMLDISRTLARQGLSFRNVHEEDSNFVQLVQLVGRYNTTMGAWLTESEINKRPFHTTYMSKVSQEEFITLLGENIEKKIVEEVNSAEMIGIIADTTPDITHMDQLTVGVRFIDSNNKPKERLIDTAEIQDKTGEGMAKGIVKSLTIHNINKNLIRFQTYDSTASMSGIYKGAQQKLSEILEKPIIYIPCTPHGANLVIEHGCNASQLIRNMFDILEAAYVFISSSTKRHDVLKNKLKMNEFGLQLKNLSKTRWSARPDAIVAFWKSFHEICKALEEISNPQSNYDSITKSKANGLLNKIKSFDFIMALMFMKNIMSKTKYMVDVLQTETLDISGAIITMKSTKEILEGISNNSSEQKNLVDAALAFAETLGVSGEEEFRRVHRPRRLPKRFDDSDIESNTEEITLYSYYSKEMKVVLDMLTSVLNSKFENLKSKFKPFYDVLDPKEDLKDYETERFSEALQTLAKTYPNEIHDTKMFENELQIFNINLFDYVKKHPDVSISIRFAAEKALNFYKENNLFPQVAKVFKLFLTAPPSVCKSERSFSRLKLLKSYLRNRICEKRLHYMMLLACENDLTDQLDLQKIVDKWKIIKSRRIQV